MPHTIKLFGTEFQVNTTTLNGQFQSHVTALPTGLFEITWNDFSNDAPGAADCDIRIAGFLADGTSAGPETLVNLITPKWQIDSDVAGLADGASVVVWTDYNPDVSPNGHGIEAQLFDRHGDFLGDPVRVDILDNEDQAKPTVAGLTNGDLVIAFEALDFLGTGPDPFTEAIEMVIIHPDGTITDPVLVNTITTGSQNQPSITSLSGGGFVIAWSDDSEAAPDTSFEAVRAQVYDAQGHAVGGEILANTAISSHQYNSTVTGLSTGGFVIAWEDYSQTGTDQSSSAVRGQVFDATGTMVGVEFQINTQTLSSQFNVKVAALADGRFVAVWADGSLTGGDADGTAIKAQVFNANGSLWGHEFLVNTVTAGFQIEPDVAVLADGRFVVSWSSNDGVVDTSSYGIEGQILDARTHGIDLAGTTLSDNYIGSRFRDTLEGNNGADGLSGGKGRDRIIGGFGNDTVAGDSGKDRLYGDSGNDSISGGKGKDWIESGLGTDHLFGGKGADVFFFTIQEEAGKGASRDVIADFRSGVDTLDFSSFMTIGHFIGANTFHGGGKVEVNFFANTHILSGDVDGDGHADFELTLTGAHLVAGDIVF